MGKKSRMMKLLQTLYQFLLLLLLSDLLTRYGAFIFPTALHISTAETLITADNSCFGPMVEGTAVDRFGKVFAVNFGSTEKLGQLANASGAVEQQLYFEWVDKKSYFNGIRFFPGPGLYNVENSKHLAATAVVADKAGQIVQVVDDRDNGSLKGRIFCKDERMIEPNDVAVAYKSGRVYSSGLNYAPTTTIGDGDIWMCEISNSADFDSEHGPVAQATRLLVQGRANGVEVSPDERLLYISETWAEDMVTYSNKVWKFDIDSATGMISNKRLFFDMQPFDDESKSTIGFDIDGMRADRDGNLFTVRNGAGEVLKISPAGVPLVRIRLPGITKATNLDFGGPDGKWLYVVGSCNSDPKVGCVDVWRGNEVSGRAFHALVWPGYTFL